MMNSAKMKISWRRMKMIKNLHDHYFYTFISHKVTQSFLSISCLSMNNEKPQFIWISDIFLQVSIDQTMIVWDEWEYEKNCTKLSMMSERLMKSRREELRVEKEDFLNMIRFLTFIDVNIDDIAFPSF